MPTGILEDVLVYFEGFGGLGFTTPVVSYAPRPMFMISLSRNIIEVNGKEAD